MAETEENFLRADTKDLSFDKIASVQEKCGEAMRLWGYRAYASEAELDSVHPVDELTM